MPFLIFARPGPGPLLVGGALAALGLLIRGWAAGTIRKDERLTTWGPYAYVRHPLYVGSMLIGVGLGVAGGDWVWPVLVLAFFAAIYGPTISEEAERLTRLFGDRYAEYAAHVPALLPGLRPYRPSNVDATPGFEWSRYVRHCEWEALLGALGALTLLAIKVRLSG